MWQLKTMRVIYDVPDLSQTHNDVQWCKSQDPKHCWTGVEAHKLITKLIICKLFSHGDVMDSSLHWKLFSCDVHYHNL